MKITPDYIREQQKEYALARPIKVDLIMEAYINDLICRHYICVTHKNIVEQGITMDDFIEELLGRGFAVTNNIGRYFEDGGVVISLPPSLPSPLYNGFNELQIRGE